MVIGHVTQGTSGRLNFEYEQGWLDNPGAIPLSLSMPLSAARHRDDSIKPYLWGLLPDSEATLSAWASRFGVSSRNAFALLTHVGETCKAPSRWCLPTACLSCVSARA